MSSSNDEAISELKRRLVELTDQVETLRERAADAPRDEERIEDAQHGGGWQTPFNIDEVSESPVSRFFPFLPVGSRRPEAPPNVVLDPKTLLLLKLAATEPYDGDKGWFLWRIVFGFLSLLVCVGLLDSFVDGGIYYSCEDVDSLSRENNTLNRITFSVQLALVGASSLIHWYMAVTIRHQGPIKERHERDQSPQERDQSPQERDQSPTQTELEKGELCKIVGSGCPGWAVLFMANVIRFIRFTNKECSSYPDVDAKEKKAVLFTLILWTLSSFQAMVVHISTATLLALDCKNLQSSLRRLSRTCDHKNLQKMIQDVVNRWQAFLFVHVILEGSAHVGLIIQGFLLYHQDWQSAISVFGESIMLICFLVVQVLPIQRYNGEVNAKYEESLKVGSHRFWEPFWRFHRYPVYLTFFRSTPLQLTLSPVLFKGIFTTLMGQAAGKLVLWMLNEKLMPYAMPHSNGTTTLGLATG